MTAWLVKLLDPTIWKLLINFGVQVHNLIDHPTTKGIVEAINNAGAVAVAVDPEEPAATTTTETPAA